MISDTFEVNVKSHFFVSCFHLCECLGVSVWVNLRFYFPASMDQAARCSVPERIKIEEAYFVTKSVVLNQRQFRKDFPSRKAPTRFTIQVAGHVQSGQKITSWLWNNAWSNLQENPQEVCLWISSRKFSYAHNAPNLDLFPCKMQILQLLTKQIRLRDVPLCKPSVNEPMKILVFALGLHFFSDEATFHLNDHVNRQNMRFGAPAQNINISS